MQPDADKGPICYKRPNWGSTMSAKRENKGKEGRKKEVADVAAL